MILRCSWLWLAVVFCIACTTTGIKTEPLPYALDIVKVVVESNLPAEIDSLSVNGREYVTQTFQLPSKYAKRIGRTRDGKLLERAWAKVVILGEHRPFTLEISVFTQELGLRDYFPTGENKEYALWLAEKIKRQLVQRHEKMDLIDDFRAF